MRKLPPVIEDWKVIFDPAGHRYYLAGWTEKVGQIVTAYISSVDRLIVDTETGESFILGEADSNFEARLKAVNPLWNPEQPLGEFVFQSAAIPAR